MGYKEFEFSANFKDDENNDQKQKEEYFSR